MAIVKGKIETLKRIREVLDTNGIHQFTSVAEINSFLQNYEKDRNTILLHEKNHVEEELVEKCTEISVLEMNYKSELEKREGCFTAKTERYKKRFKIHKETKPQELIDKSDRALYMIGYKVLELLFFGIGKYYPGYASQKLKKNWLHKKDQFEKMKLQKESLIAERSSHRLKEQEKIKKVVDDLKPVIAGALGESRVDKELRKLSDSYIVYNDFSFSYNKMFAHRPDARKMYSVQIDHLLISNAGIFILETKNWSKKSIENLNMRSPIQQITRARRALDFYVSNRGNQRQIFKETSHWGKREIPIRNVIVMIHGKPFGEFQFVAIKLVHELLGYLKTFKPVLTDAEVYRLSRFLESIKD
ncbi:nuclease-related domain-containing protein [Flavicella sp.]|uniref:nuclease-related domain-containing protein n=1 Tax=Flavicella sp. TaxID=2957742 RepID=UPI00260E2A2F|nr:nuclease-related domain-containing protein [Flavicella sp.]MDG1804706.1 nuclease-related domain-containing protein [Flavicella sp.]